MNTRTLVLLAGLVALAWSVRRWRSAVRLAMFVLVFEGAARKWLLPGAQDLIYFGKDVLLLGAYAGWATRRDKQPGVPLPPALLVILIAGAAWGLFEMVNPNLPTPLLGLLGFKSYFLYTPLLWVLPAAFESDQDLAGFLKQHLILAVPVGVLATAQFFSSADSRLNVYARGGLERATTFGSSSFVRVTGTFSYISGYSAYLLATSVLLLGVLATTGWRMLRPRWPYIALAFVLVGMLMTGSRGPVVSLALVVPLYLGLIFLRERNAPVLLTRFLGGAALLVLLLRWLAPEAIGAFVGRASDTSEYADRMAQPFLAAASAFERGSLLGYGIGATHQAAGAVVGHFGPPYWLRGNVIETETGRIMLELGPIGFVLIYAFRIGLLVTVFGLASRMRSRFRRAFGIACFLFLLTQLPASSVFDPTASLYYWFVAGLAFTLAALEKREAARPAAAPRAQLRPAGPTRALAPAR